MQPPIYLDYNATTPVAAEVIEAIAAALRDCWGNPSSSHPYGRRARQAVDRARGQVAALLGCSSDELVFTSGGTESDNAAVVGIAEARAARGRHVISSAIEHPAVEQACRYLESRGWEVTRVGVDAAGRVDPAAVEAAIREDTTLISIIHAHNETGVIQPIRVLSEQARRRGVVVHTDAAQSVGKIAVRVDELGVDALTVAGHKLYAPPGVGALFLRRGTPFAALLRGGGHEEGRRSGTENVSQIVGLGAACALAREELEQRIEVLGALRDRLEAGLRRRFPDLVVHGAAAERLPNTSFVALPGHDAGALLERAEGVAAAAGAACHSGDAHLSSALRAMGVPDELARSTLRLTVGRDSTPEQIDLAAARLAAAAAG